jgi:ParB family chromosome partitioning protein
MALTSRFGSSSPDGKTAVPPSRVDRLAAQAASLAAKRPTQTSVERMEQAAPVPPAAAPAGAAAAAAAPTGRRPIDAIRPSPFQPRGRPSPTAVAAVGAAIREAGSLESLVSRAGAPIFARLDAEAARLAELAYSIAENGVEVPVEVRTAEDGADECLSGHRRLAAARLAGLAEVPVVSRGALSSAQAAARVLTGNLHREAFTAWQEAVLVTQVQERRRVDGLAADVRTLGSVMGWSAGKVHQLLRARQVFTSDALARLGDGDATRVEDGLARLQPAELKRLVEQPDEAARTAAVRRALGIAPGDAPEPAGARAAFTHRPKRGGGFVLEVHEPVESLAAGDAALVYETLATQLARVRARLEQLGHPVR